jgi:hypothetical protein
MMEGKKGGSTVSTDSTVKPVLRGLPWEKEKCGFIRQVTSSMVDNVTNSNNTNTPMVNFNPFNTQSTDRKTGLRQIK